MCYVYWQISHVKRGRKKESGTFNFNFTKQLKIIFTINIVSNSLYFPLETIFLSGDDHK